MIISTEGVHDWNDGEVILNDRLSFPKFHVEEIPGLRRTPDFEPIADKSVSRLGEVPRRADRGGKTITYNGQIRARSLSDLREQEALLTAAFSTTEEKLMEARVHASSDLTLPTRHFWARPLDRDDDDTQQGRSPQRTDYGYARDFSIALRLSDPRYYYPFAEAVAEESEAIIMAGGNGTPYVPGDQVEPASGEAIEVTVDSPGNADVDPLIEIEGPARNPVLSNESLGVFLRFRDLDLDTGEVVQIDFRRRTANRASGTSVRHKLDPAETWWNPGIVGLQPERYGTNVIRYRAYDMGVGARLSVWHIPADYA